MATRVIKTRIKDISMTLDKIMNHYIINYLELNGMASVDIATMNKTHIDKFFHGRNIHSLHQFDFFQYKADRVKVDKAAINSINREFTTLTAAIYKALDNGFIDAPRDEEQAKKLIEFIKTQRTAAVVKEYIPTHDECCAVIEKLNSPYSELAQAAYFTAYRFSELATLQWRQYSHTRNNIILSTSKTGEGRQTFLYSELRDLFKQLYEQAKERGDDMNNGLVFYKKGKPINHFRIAYNMRKAVDDCSLSREFTFHSFRKAAVKWLHDHKGYDRYAIMDSFGGWSRNSDIFDRVYNQSTKEDFKYYEKLAMEK